MTLSVPTRVQPAGPPIAPVRDGHHVRDLGPEFGQVHAFRIRGPCGKDSLYVVLASKPRDGAAALLDVSGPREVSLVRKQFPYEFSVYPWPADAPATIRFGVSAGAQRKTALFTMPGR